MVTLDGAVAVVTGGASGIGRALAERFAAAGARAVVVADLDAARVEQTAAALGPTCHGIALDVASGRGAVTIAQITAEIGEIDLWCPMPGRLARTRR
jgi:D-sorbitol dehydrogenase (acceptor)